MTSRRMKSLEADLAQRKVWAEKRRAAYERCEAISDLDPLAEAARDWLLAMADEQEYVYGPRNADYTRMYRRRANSEDYRYGLATFWLAQRMMKRLDADSGLSKAEQEARDARERAESAALLKAINAMVERAYR